MDFESTDITTRALRLARSGDHIGLARLLQQHSSTINGLKRIRVGDNFESLLDAAVLALHPDCVSVVIDHVLQHSSARQRRFQMSHARDLWLDQARILLPRTTITLAIAQLDSNLDNTVIDERVEQTLRELIRVFEGDLLDISINAAFGVVPMIAAINYNRPLTFTFMATDDRINIDWSTEVKGWTLLGHAIGVESRINSPDAPFTTWILNNIRAFSGYEFPITVHKDIRDWFVRVVVPRTGARVAPVPAPLYHNESPPASPYSSTCSLSPPASPASFARGLSNRNLSPLASPASPASHRAFGKRSADTSPDASDVDSSIDVAHVRAVAPLKRRCMTGIAALRAAIHVLENMQENREDEVMEGIYARARAAAMREADDIIAAARTEADDMRNAARDDVEDMLAAGREEVAARMMAMQAAMCRAISAV